MDSDPSMLFWIQQSSESFVLSTFRDGLLTLSISCCTSSLYAHSSFLQMGPTTVVSSANLMMCLRGAKVEFLCHKHGSNFDAAQPTWSQLCSILEVQHRRVLVEAGYRCSSLPSSQMKASCKVTNVMMFSLGEEKTVWMFLLLIWSVGGSCWVCVCARLDAGTKTQEYLFNQYS